MNEFFMYKNGVSLSRWAYLEPDPDFEKKRTLYQNSLYDLKTKFRQFEGADFKYDNIF